MQESLSEKGISEAGSTSEIQFRIYHQRSRMRGRFSGPPLQNTGAHHKRTIFIMKWHTGRSHLCKALFFFFFAAGMDNILKVTLEKLLALEQSQYFEIKIFLHNLCNFFFVPGQWINKWLHRIKYFNPRRKVGRGWGRVGEPTMKKTFLEANMSICGRGTQLSLIPFSM